MKKGNSVFCDLINSFKYYRESKNGKYSLDTYLEIIGKYTDQVIKEAEKEQLEYLGGICEVENNIIKNVYVFEISMYFEDIDGKRFLKKANRSLNKKYFTTETEDLIQEKKIFEINRPNK